MSEIAKMLSAEDVWAGFALEDMAGEIEEGEKTVEMYAELIHKSPPQAAKILLRRVHAGEMTRRLVMVNSRRGYAYRPVEIPKA